MINDDLIVQKIPRENPSTAYRRSPSLFKGGFFYQAPLKRELAAAG